MAAKIKSGDLVKVIRGKDRGKEGTVKQVLKDDRLIVEGVQIVKKHVRATQQGQQAGIVAVEAPTGWASTRRPSSRPALASPLRKRRVTAR